MYYIIILVSQLNDILKIIKYEVNNDKIKLIINKINDDSSIILYFRFIRCINR